MDLSQLRSIGEIAGIGGISLGVVVLVLRPLIAAITGMPKESRTGPVKLIATGCFILGALGIAAWTFANRPPRPQVSTEGTQSPAITSGGNANVSYGSVPEQSPVSPTNTLAAPAPSGTAKTEGNQSPAVIVGGSVGVQYSTPPTSSPSASSGTK
jgi:hypothetical protein